MDVSRHRLNIYVLPLDRITIWVAWKRLQLTLFLVDLGHQRVLQSRSSLVPFGRVHLLALRTCHMRLREHREQRMLVDSRGPCVPHVLGALSRLGDCLEIWVDDSIVYQALRSLLVAPVSMLSFYISLIRLSVLFSLNHLRRSILEKLIFCSLFRFCGLTFLYVSLCIYNFFVTLKLLLVLIDILDA